jgi:hypothetical protein
MNSSALPALGPCSQYLQQQQEQQEQQQQRQQQ